MTVILDMPFASMADMPRVLRSAACTGPVVKIAMAPKFALQLARQIETVAETQAALDLVRNTRAAAMRSADELHQKCTDLKAQCDELLRKTFGMICLGGALGAACAVLGLTIGGWFA